jgi:hypothetical protein
MKSLLEKNTLAVARDFLSPLKTIRKEIGYAELEQAEEIMARFRNRLRLMVKNYRSWKADYMSERDELEKAYMASEGIFLRRQLGDAWKLYAMVNQDYHEMRRGYLANLRQPPHYSSGAA